MVAREGAEVHDDIQGLRRGAAFAHGRDVNGRLPVRECAANDQRGIVFPVGGARRRVEQLALLISALCPAQSRATHQPFVAREFLAEFDPVIGAAVLDHLQAAEAGGVGVVVTGDPIRAVGRGRHDIG